MYTTYQLFYKCAWTVEYQTAGNDVNYAFEEQGDTLYIFFEGSSSITDWIRNFLFRKRPYKDMKIPYKVHRGFLKAWKEVEDIIITKITEKEPVVMEDPEAISNKYSLENDFDYKWKKIVVVGYSHGGALAAFCHECVWFWRPDLRETGLIGYGFEAPRIFGSFRVPKALKERWETFFVVRTNNDIVTHCPPVIFGYCHVGEILQVYGDIKLVNKCLPKCIKSHYPQVVYDGLIKFENSK